eukprot:TRINITY_DN46775_c0_g1_i1.p1 TRINITY_DN46775_c0_g1~~TRINITY_DN46775_c0_g1_i1.p1  ORF type:complete len:906 (+),score=233.20 TRINITY_DN46775_c0_g1_i1:65-2782(+)
MAEAQGVSPRRARAATLPSSALGAAPVHSGGAPRREGAPPLRRLKSAPLHPPAAASPKQPTAPPNPPMQPAAPPAEWLAEGAQVFELVDKTGGGVLAAIVVSRHLGRSPALRTLSRARPRAWGRFVEQMAALGDAPLTSVQFGASWAALRRDAQLTDAAVAAIAEAARRNLLTATWAGLLHYRRRHPDASSTDGPADSLSAQERSVLRASAAGRTHAARHSPTGRRSPDGRALASPLPTQSADFVSVETCGGSVQQDESTQTTVTRSPALASPLPPPPPASGSVSAVRGTLSGPDARTQSPRGTLTGSRLSSPGARPAQGWRDGEYSGQLLSPWEQEGPGMASASPTRRKRRQRTRQGRSPVRRPLRQLAPSASPNRSPSGTRVDPKRTPWVPSGPAARPGVPPPTPPRAPCASPLSAQTSLAALTVVPVDAVEVTFEDAGGPRVSFCKDGDFLVLTLDGELPARKLHHIAWDPEAGEIKLPSDGMSFTPHPDDVPRVLGCLLGMVKTLKGVQCNVRERVLVPPAVRRRPSPARSPACEASPASDQRQPMRRVRVCGAGDLPPPLARELVERAQLEWTSRRARRHARAAVTRGDPCVMGHVESSTVSRGVAAVRFDDGTAELWPISCLQFVAAGGLRGATGMQSGQQVAPVSPPRLSDKTFGQLGPETAAFSKMKGGAPELRSARNWAQGLRRDLYLQTGRRRSSSAAPPDGGTSPSSSCVRTATPPPPGRHSDSERSALRQRLSRIADQPTKGHDRDWRRDAEKKFNRCTFRPQLDDWSVAVASRDGGGALPSNYRLDKTAQDRMVGRLHRTAESPRQRNQAPPSGVEEKEQTYEVQRRKCLNLRGLPTDTAPTSFSPTRRIEQADLTHLLKRLHKEVVDKQKQQPRSSPLQRTPSDGRPSWRR